MEWHDRMKRPLNIAQFDPAIRTISTARAAELDAALTHAAIPQVQQLFQQGKLTSEELVSYYLWRIKRYDYNKLNSVTELNPDALEIAKQLDAERAAGKVRGPLHGTAALISGRLPPGLPEPEQAVADLTRVLSFPHSGDLVLLGAWNGAAGAAGRVATSVVSFEDQAATHGGLGGPQDYPFFSTPPDAPLDLSGVTSARELYPYFIERFQGIEAQGAKRSEEGIAPEPGEGG